MKKILIIFILACLVVSRKANAQVPDTLAYLQSIVANKSQFIGHPFSVLMDSLKIQIKFFAPFSGMHYDTTKETSTSFSFYLPQGVSDLYLSYPRLDIIWYPYLNAVESGSLHSQYRTVGWAPAIASFYSSGIIKDIVILER